MKIKIERILKSIFSIFLMIAMLGGGIVFLMFIGAIILGGDLGASLAVSARNVVMPYFIRFASIAVFAGLIYSYLSNKHGLSL